jgi:cold shock CspA family protein/uncharacterized LabA/DUF88 family protein
MILSNNNGSISKIGVFYDGSYFLYVSNFYNWFHEKKARISIAGLHKFIREQVAKEEDIDPRFCRIVDAHYFRGRLNANEAQQKGNQLYYDRVFDDILMAEGVTLHYLPLRGTGVSKQEKGIDVWLALEALELAYFRQFDVLVLIASDGDYVPLVRKMNGIGIPVMLLSWDFDFVNDEGQKVVTRTSQELLEEVTYPIAMHEFIENEDNSEDPLYENLFVPRSAERIFHKPLSVEDLDGEEGETHESEIQNLKSGYGFIAFNPSNLFFHYSSLIDSDFNDVRVGDKVRFTIGTNERGEAVARNIELLESFSLEQGL